MRCAVFLRSALPLTILLSLALLFSPLLVSVARAEGEGSNAATQETEQPKQEGASNQDSTNAGSTAVPSESASQAKPESKPVKGTWSNTSAGWKYLVEGSPARGFVNDGGKTYYLDPASGIMRIGWVKIDGVWYRFAPSGAMQKGWVKDGPWYYLNPDDGKMLTGKHAIGNATYFLTSSGAMKTGWNKEEGIWFFYDGSGAMAKGWRLVGGAWYLMSYDDGKMLTGKQKDATGKTYFLTSSGAMKTGWNKEGNDWYYYVGSGAMKTGWIWTGAWYYLNPADGKMLTGKYNDGSAWYISDGSGAMHANRWVKLTEGWYYASSSGALKTGWLYSGSKWYWLDGAKDGLMIASEKRTIANALYSFDSNGAMHANCQIEFDDGKIGYAASSGAITTIGESDGNKVILKDASGNLLTGWHKIGGTWFYADKNSVMQTGWLADGGKWYWLGADGAMATSCWVDGGKYYVGSDGAWIQTTIIQDIRGQFAHGTKTAQYQKYIMVHDTEGGGTPQNVVSGWAAAGNYVAAHFVIGKDGTTIQCVPLDQIAHHAGFAPRGSNAAFGVYEDGRDDRRGTVGIGSYSPDYGMNSFSVGIELVHDGSSGEGYPKAQLEALDRVIAYIDSHYGFQSTIIDHKMWNGNSDTSKEFAGYLANYRAHRTHY